MDAEKILEGFLSQMQGAQKSFDNARTGLLEVSLMPFEALFQKDENGNYVSSNLEKKDVDEIMKSFDEELIIPGLPVNTAATSAIKIAVCRLIRGVTPATNAKAIASGTKANATVIPAKISARKYFLFRFKDSKIFCTIIY